MSAAQLQVQNVSKSFGSQRVVQDVSLNAQRGSITAIIGPSGSGKTTLLRMIAGFEVPDAGRVLLGGKDLTSGAKPVPAHRRKVGYVPQDGALFPHLSVAKNIAFGLKGRQSDRVAELLEVVSLPTSFAKRHPDELSGGQQQRVALARALAREPDLMLLDEPFSALDAALRNTTRRAVGKILNEAGITTVLVTHDQAEALSFADQVAVLRNGQLSQVGSPFVVYNRPSDRETAEFLGDAVMLEAIAQDGIAVCALGRIPISRGPFPVQNGAVKIMLRPEQIRVVPESEVSGRVVDSEFFGPETTLRIRLDSLGASAPNQLISIRHWNSSQAFPGAELKLRVAGEAVVLADHQGD
ncbi:iron(III) transport system ATP-binding protein [Psychromicrobium silvestre]|uniref:ABC-type quaternary amine transporter n=1 Tax=Psychromicrobium silvestre TaxID=1645614 RepID=A0A7Y9LUM4_9MICC|nr:ABC transporter ATP-binding protein [Psychromicrobium silvestre]NYE95922.1 iron(III) transport system ATP-binding protein [Psychromicrobium silvestre]